MVAIIWLCGTPAGLAAWWAFEVGAVTKGSLAVLGWIRGDDGSSSSKGGNSSQFVVPGGVRTGPAMSWNSVPWQATEPCEGEELVGVATRAAWTVAALGPEDLGSAGAIFGITGEGMVMCKPTNALILAYSPRMVGRSEER